MKLLILMLSLTILASCSSGSSSKKKPDSGFLSASSVPAAQGNVETKTDRNGNTQVDIKVKHLAMPDRLEPGAKGYVVWLMSEGQSAYQNIGALKVNQDLEGTYSTKVPYKAFKLIVTPERSMTAQEPTGDAVLEKIISI